MIHNSHLDMTTDISSSNGEACLKQASLYLWIFHEAGLMFYHIKRLFKIDLRSVIL